MERSAQDQPAGTNTGELGDNVREVDACGQEPHDQSAAEQDFQGGDDAVAGSLIHEFP